MKIDATAKLALPPQVGFEDEILDRPLFLDDWTFSCCMTISEEDDAKTLVARPAPMAAAGHMLPLIPGAIYEGVVRRARPSR